MTIPQIKNYQQAPPRGGWAVNYTFKGQEFPLGGNWRQVLARLKNLHAKNGESITTPEAMKILNTIWCARDPGRCMSPAQASQAQKQAGATCTTCGGRRRVR